MRSVIVQNTASILLGRVGENNTTQVIWENIVSEYRENFGDGSFTLAVKRCGDQSPYFVDITADEANISWLVSGGDVAKAGMGSCELTYTVDGAIAKTQTWSTVVYNSLSADEPTDPPSPVENWVQKVIGASDRAKQSEQSASESAAQAAQDAEAARQNAASSLQNAESALQNAERAEQSANSAEEASKIAQEAARRIPVPTSADKGSSLFVGEGDKLVYRDGRGNWQQNDQNSIDYIKNRPGGYDEAKEVRVELWSGTTPPTGEADNKELATALTTFDQPFSVVIDGVENIHTPTPKTIDGETLYLFGSMTEEEIDDFLVSGETPDRGYIFIGVVDENGPIGVEYAVWEDAYAEKPFSLSIFQTAVTPVKIPAKWLESTDIIVRLAPNEDETSFVQTTSYTPEELIGAFDAGMDIRVAVTMQDQNLLLPCVGKLVDSDVAELIWAAEGVWVIMRVESSEEVLWVWITDDSTDNRFSVVEGRLDSAESRLDAAESSITAAQTAAEEAKTAADRVPAATAADKNKFLQVDASGNPAWEIFQDKLIIELDNFDDGTMTQTTSYTQEDVRAAYGKHMDLEVLANLPGVGPVYLRLLQMQDDGSSTVGTWLASTNDYTLIAIGTFSGSGDTWEIQQSMDDDTVASRLGTLESAFSDLQNSVSSLETAVDTINSSLDQKADAQSVSDLSDTVGELMPTPDDAGKFLRADNHGNPVWQAVPNANGGSF